jgi:hypothetical protein
MMGRLKGRKNGQKNNDTPLRWRCQLAKGGPDQPRRAWGGDPAREGLVICVTDVAKTWDESCASVRPPKVRVRDIRILKVSSDDAKIAAIIGTALLLNAMAIWLVLVR